MKTLKNAVKRALVLVAVTLCGAVAINLFVFAVQMALR